MLPWPNGLRRQCLKPELKCLETCLGLETVSRHYFSKSKFRLGLEGLKFRSRLGLGTSKSRKMGKSRPYFQSERKNHNNFKFLTEKKKQIPSCLNQGFLKLYLNSPWGLNISKKDNFYGINVL